MTPLHIGIVGCSAEGAALCYRTICAEGATLLGPHAHPEVSIHTPSFARYCEHLERNDWLGVGELMLESANRLARIGCGFLICPDNTIHQALPLIEMRLPLPWLHIADVVADEASRRGFRRLGLTGTRWLVASDVYPDRLTQRRIAFERPSAEARDKINRHYHGRARLRRREAGERRIFSTSPRGDERTRLRCRRPRLHRDPADYR